MVDVRRFWSPLGHPPQLDARGFLAESFSLFGTSDSDGAGDDALVATDGLGGARGLVLLGPPGSGKTVELGRIYGQEERSGPTILVELGAVADAEDLRQQLFGHDAFGAWRRGRADLTLFLDSVDEGVLSVQNLSAVLRRELRAGPGNRLRIRVTCRAADWPEGLGAWLHEFIGEADIRTLSLAPLRARDAVAIAEAELGEDAGGLFEGVAQAGAGPLAALPLTLRLLAEVYRRQGQLPERPADLFEQATLYLCEEANLDRLDAGRTGAQGAAVRHDLATRIAGLLRLSGKTHLDTGAAALVRPDALVVGDLAAPSGFPPTPFPLDPSAVRDLVRHSGLFEPAGPRSHRFVHAALGEFLAARFLHRQGTPSSVALALVSHPNGGVLPQLRQVASWLSALAPEFFDLFGRIDPEAALAYATPPPGGSARRSSSASSVSQTGEPSTSSPWTDSP